MQLNFNSSTLLFVCIHRKVPEITVRKIFPSLTVYIVL